MSDILDEIEALSHKFGHAAVDAGLTHVRDSRIGQSREGQAALQVVDALVDRFGDDAIEWVFRRMRQRMHHKEEKRVDEAQAALDRAEERAKARIHSDDK